MTVGVTKRVKPIPPDRGSFPLDHEGVCKDLAETYLNCIKNRNGDSMKCRNHAAKYMKCRMDNGLLTNEPLTHLGFRESEIRGESNESEINFTRQVGKSRKESQGFVAGTSVVDNYAQDESRLSKFLSKFLK